MRFPVSGRFLVYKYKIVDYIFDILKIVLPAGLVFATAFYAIKKFLENDQKKRMLELRKDGQKVVTPIRLQAYERVVMFLERIGPEALLGRVNKKGMDAKDLQMHLINAINDEFNHNISQQLYMSNEAWIMVKSGKEEMIKLINIASSKMQPNSSGLELAKIIFQLTIQVGKLPLQDAVDYLKAELRQSF